MPDTSLPSRVPAASHGALPRSFYFAGFAVGIALSTMWVSMPLLAIESDVSSTAIGVLYGVSTLSIAVAAAGATFIIGRAGPRNILVSSLALTGIGELLLAVPSGIAGLAVGVAVIGAGTGLFWTGSMALMAAAAGADRSERAFVWHYVGYIAGSAAGSVAAGLVTVAARSAHVSPADSLRLSFGVGIVAIAVAAMVWRPGRAPAVSTAKPRWIDLPMLGLVLQAPCLLLVAAMGLVFPLIPLVLGRAHGYSALAIGLVTALTAIARVLGTLLGGRLASLHGSSKTTAAMLTFAAGATAGEVVFGDLPGVFIALILAVYLAAIGAWPIGVAAALGRVDPRRRSAMSAAWNLREYVVIAGAVALSGALFGHGGARIPFLGATGLLVLAAVAAAFVFRRPVIVPLAREGSPDATCRPG
jgi:MFS family permease